MAVRRRVCSLLSVNDSLPLILGTRGSALALAQARLTLEALQLALPGGVFQTKEIKTTGDKRLDLSLTQLAPGGHGYEQPGSVAAAASASPGALRPRERLDPGLFTKELEAELLAGTISVAVHSLKDLPTSMPAGLTLAAVLPRADTADALIYKIRHANENEPPDDPVAQSVASFGDAAIGFLPLLPLGAVVATSSLRRQRQLLWRRPDLRVEEVRGNVGTRLKKLRERDDWTALILARAGLERLGHGEQLRAGYLETPEAGRFAVTMLDNGAMLPAVGQGAIALQARADDARTLAALAAINCGQTFAAILAERELLRLLGGGCQMPLGVGTDLDADGTLRLRAILFRASGEPPLTAEAAGPSADPLAIAEQVARQLQP
jgi:hydroxymethylbilane synthase